MVPPRLVLAVGLVAACDHGMYGSARTHAPPVPRAAPFVDEVPADPTRPGPLSPDHGEIAMTWGGSPWYELARTTYLDAAALGADAAVVQAALGAMPVLPGSPGADRWATWLAELPDLARLAPYSLLDTLTAYQQGSPLLCARAPGAVFGCQGNRPGLTPRGDGPPFEVSTPAPGVRMLRVHDLTGAPAAAEAWATLPAAAPWDGTPLVLDLRDARGSDPRPMLAWLEAAVGRQPLWPLQRIDAPAALAPLVDAYRARYRDDVRDAAAWATLVAPAGDAPTISAPQAPATIAVVVGPGCQAACEMVARVLETYVDAEVYGASTSGHQLGQDQPALLRLPASGVQLYFYAATYRLTDDIEARTGPTGAWRGFDGGPYDDAAMAEVVRWTRARAVRPGWPVPCRDLPASLAATTRAGKLGGWIAQAGIPWNARITLTVAPGAFLRWLAACPGARAATPLGPREVVIYRAETLGPLLERIAGSELVERIDGEARVDPVLNTTNDYDR